MLPYDTTDQLIARRPLNGSGRVPPSCSAHIASLRREGEFWTVVFNDQVCRLKDSKGLRYLARLLSHPGAEFHVLDLVRSQYHVWAGGDRWVSATGAVADGGVSILDERAKQAYRHRLRELREELSEAERFNDLGRTERMRTELEALREQLAGAVGLGGRDRVAACASERARSTVTQRLRDAIRKISAHAPILGEHLQRSLRTGTFCVYLPGIAQVIHWSLE